MTREDKVKQFRDAGNKKNMFEAPEDFQMIMDCIHEEFLELFDAARQFRDEPSEQTRANVVKEWADVQYVVSQAALYLDIPADAAFDRVHDNNMTKVIDGKLRLREDGKILKPEGYVPADMRGL